MARAAIKRLMSEYQALIKEDDRVCDIYAKPLEDNIFEWHFTILGPKQYQAHAQSKHTKAAACTSEDAEKRTERHGDADDDEDDAYSVTPYRHGIYHGRLIFPRTYPLEPPDIIFLTPSGRFATNQKICSSISSFHKESWRPSYDVRFTLLSLRLFMAQEDEQGVGAIPPHAFSPAAKAQLARDSWNFVCRECSAGDAAETQINDTRGGAASHDGDDATAASTPSWTMRVLYEKEMKPYPETSQKSDAATAASAAPTTTLAAPPQGEQMPEAASHPIPSDTVAEAIATPEATPAPVPVVPVAQHPAAALPEDVVVIHVHHLRLIVSVRLLWHIVAVCCCLIGLILGRRGIVSLIHR